MQKTEQDTQDIHDTQDKYKIIYFNDYEFLVTINF